MDFEAVKTYFADLQNRIVESLQLADGKHFLHDAWQRPEGGGGISCVLEEGHVLERGGVNFSHVSGDRLPPSASAGRPELAGRGFVATKPGEAPVWWFGGGMDLTPYYGFEEDAVHFHRTCQQALAPFGAGLYPELKKWCDEYFYLKHRKEPRGVGGVFFDDFNRLGFEQSFAMLRAVGDAFLQAYLPILQRRKETPYSEREREFQAYRRGRYVEFNLVFDRGTLFGLQSGGRTESILMSMPPIVKWRYDWQPEPGSAEARLYSDFLIGRNWLDEA